MYLHPNVFKKKRPSSTKGILLGQKLPLKLKEIWGIRIRLQIDNKTRELALFNLAIDSKLRSCDLVKLKVQDVYRDGHVLQRAMVLQQKTHLPVQFEITDTTRKSLSDWIAKKNLKKSDYLFPSQRRPNTHIGARHYGRIVKKWVASIGLDPTSYGTHTMRRTKAALIYKKTKNIRAVQLLLGHTKLENTVRYLGIDVDDALELSEETEV